MNGLLILGLCLGLGVLATGGFLIYVLFVVPPSSKQAANSLKRSAKLASLHENQILSEKKVSSENFDKIKLDVQKRNKSIEKISFEEKLFQAGLFSLADKNKFLKSRSIFPIIGGVAIFIFAFVGTNDILLALISTIVGVLFGMRLPFMMLDKEISRRHEEILYFLPLVIEQIAIGVSSSLDVGPCISRIIQMADERDCHNPVTELFLFAQNYVKSGASFEEAMNEVGIRSGHNELKHAFKSLGQVAKHGGELTRQLQELAEAVGLQREAKIEAKIKTLELKATGPLGLVFVGFFMILLSGFFLQITTMLGK